MQNLYELLGDFKSNIFSSGNILMTNQAIPATKTLIKSHHHLKRPWINLPAVVGSATPQKKLLPNQRKVVVEVAAEVVEVASVVQRTVCDGWT